MLRTLVVTKSPWRNALHVSSIRPPSHSCITKPLAFARYASDHVRRPATLDLVRSIRVHVDRSLKDEAATKAYIRKQLEYWLPRIARPTAACEKVITVLVDKDCASEAREVFDYMIDHDLNPSAATMLMFSGAASSSVFKEKKMKAAVDAIGQAIKPDMSEEGVYKTVSKLLDQYLRQFKSHADLYEGIIFLLIKKGRLQAATAMYECMLNAGFVASSLTDARLMTLSIAMSEDKEDAQTYLNGLGALFAQDEFTGDDILELIYIGSKCGLGGDMSAAIIQMYMESRPEGEDVHFDPRLVKKLITAQAASGNVEGALGTLALQHQKGNLPSSPKLSQHLYSELLGAIRHAGPVDQDAVGTVLETMHIHGIKPSTPIFNNLIANAVRSRNIQEAFQIYYMMKSMKNKEIKPDSFTYGSLWNAITELYSPRAARRNRKRDVIIAPRQLYREMITTLIPFSVALKQKQDTKLPSMLTSALLDVTLRAFLSAKDYPGAFVVVRSFVTWHIRPRVKTYNVVLTRLMGRLHRELKSMRLLGESRWADRYIGLPKVVPVGILAKIQADERMEDHLLKVAKHPQWSLDAPPYMLDGNDDLLPVRLVHDEESDKPDYIIPTPEMLEGDNKPPAGTTFSHVPIERMLRRAILADHRRTYDSPPPGAIVSHAIQDAKKEMIPEGTANRAS
ncbi:hypothetical protein BDQ17DRAFT_1354602 [Cyathus striatus]|nr:hypothetical protein BDQ17DRAFT_1354602 [Cyathus striatus]